MGDYNFGMTFVLLIFITTSSFHPGDRGNRPSASNMMVALFSNPETVATIEATKTTSAMIDPSIINKALSPPSIG
jgi:hypothetical protein